MKKLDDLVRGVIHILEGLFTDPSMFYDSLSWPMPQFQSRDFRSFSKSSIFNGLSGDTYFVEWKFPFRRQPIIAYNIHRFHLQGHTCSGFVWFLQLQRNCCKARTSCKSRTCWKDRTYWKTAAECLHWHPKIGYTSWQKLQAEFAGLLKPFAAARVEVPRLESACAVRLLSSLSEVREPSSLGGLKERSQLM